MILPIIVGSGERLFADGIDELVLELVDSETFGSGVSPTGRQRAKAIGGMGASDRLLAPDTRSRWAVQRSEVVCRYSETDRDHNRAQDGAAHPTGDHALR